jgi:hypothetical protein
LRKVVTNYRDVELYKPPTSPELSTEFYLICSNKLKDTKASFAHIENWLWMFENKRRTAVGIALDAGIKCNYTTEPPVTLPIPHDFSVGTGDINDFVESLRNVPGQPKLYDTIRPLVKDELTDFNMTMNVGVFGSCKTRDYMRLLKKNTLIIAPTNELAEDLRKKVPHKYRLTVRVRTFHTALLSEKVSQIIIDEAYCYYLGYFAILHQIFKVPMFAYGDPAQISAIDFLGDFTHSRTLQQEYSEYSCKTTARSPNDAVTAVNRLGYNDVKTTRGQANSLIWLPCSTDAVRTIREKLQILMIVFNKTRLTIFGADVPSRTIHGSQGHTFSHLILFVDSFAYDVGATNSLRHVCVAMQRHTDTLIIAGSVDGLYRTVYLENRPLDINNHLFEAERGRRVLCGAE